MLAHFSILIYSCQIIIAMFCSGVLSKVVCNCFRPPNVSAHQFCFFTRIDCFCCVLCVFIISKLCILSNCIELLVETRYFTCFLFFPEVFTTVLSRLISIRTNYTQILFNQLYVLIDFYFYLLAPFNKNNNIVLKFRCQHKLVRNASILVIIQFGWLIKQTKRCSYFRSIYCHKYSDMIINHEQTRACRRGGGREGQKFVFYGSYSILSSYDWQWQRSQNSLFVVAGGNQQIWIKINPNTTKSSFIQTKLHFH